MQTNPAVEQKVTVRRPVAAVVRLILVRGGRGWHCVAAVAYGGSGGCDQVIV